MKFKDLIKKLLKPKKIENKLMNIRDTLNLPNKNNLSVEETNLLQEYVKEYLGLLRNRIVFSKDIDIINLTTEKDMIMSLINNLFLCEEVDYFDYIDGNPELKAIVKARKMILYLSSILKLKKEVELRLLALEEILDNNKHLNNSKINAIINKCQNLAYTLYNFKCTGEAIGVDVMASIKDMELLNVSIPEYDIEIKKAEVLEFIKFIFPDKYVEYIRRPYSNDYEMLTFLESELEKYVYRNSYIVDKFRESIIELNSSKSLDIDNLYDLEMKLKIFSLYGHNLISKDLIETLYYHIFSWSIKNIDKVNFARLNYAQMECYDKIIMGRIEKIMKNEGNILTIQFRIKPEDIKKGIDIISKILKGDSGVYSTYDILNNKKLLSFLFWDNYEFWIESFFTSYKVNISDYNFPKNSGFEWDESVPIITICELKACGYLETEDPFCELYELIKPVFESKIYYKLPEGLKNINMGLDCIRADEKLMEEIAKKSKNNSVYTPDSFRKMIGWFDIDCNTLYLNDGAEDVLIWRVNDNLCINIPSSLNFINIGFNNKSKIDGIIFYDYTESQMISNHKNLLNLLKELFYIEKFEVHSPKDKEEYKIIGPKGIYNQVYKVKPRFNVIVFENGKEKIVFKENDFKYIVYRKSDIIKNSWGIINNRNCLNDDELEALANIFEKRLFKKENFRLVRKKN